MLSVSDQLFSEKFLSYGVFYGKPDIIAAILLVITTRLTLFAWHASITAKVPLTAGLIKSFSCLGFFNGNGEAVCTTKLAPLIAANIDCLSSRSASTSVN